MSMKNESGWYAPAGVGKQIPASPPTGKGGVVDGWTPGALEAHGVYFLLLAAAAGLGHALLFTRTQPTGINAALWGALWSGIMHLALKKLDRRERARDLFCAVSMTLLGLSAAWTDNGFLQLVSLFGMTLLAFLWMLFAFSDTASWHVLRYAAGCFSLLFRGIGNILMPFRHLLTLRRGKTGKARYVLLGLVIAVPLAAVAVKLLASADDTFRRLIIARWNAPELLRTLLRAALMFLLAALGFYCLFTVQTERPADPAQGERRKGSTVTACTFAAVLAAIYLVFSVIQLGYLIPKDGQVLTRGYTYANFAREGFFQLLAVSAMNVAVVLCAGRYFTTSKALRWILAVICLCTYGMIASAAVRMLLYVHFYGFTFLRILVLWFLLVTVLLLTGTLIFVFRPDFPLFRVALVGCIALYLAFAFSRPDALAIRYDMERFGADSNTVLNLIVYQDVSLDAIPEAAKAGLRHYTGDWDDRMNQWNYTLTDIVPARYGEQDWRAFNFSLYRAYKATEGLRNGQ